MGNEVTPPLVTFVLFAYNQESFVRSAVEGAFGQTYSPLEIILSDDASTDRTFLIMKEMMDAYRGAHKVVLHRTVHNQGVAHHVNTVIPLVSGSWIVTAAADDVSLPNRVNHLMEAASKCSGVTALCSAWRNMDAKRRELAPDLDYQGRYGMTKITECKLGAQRFAFHGAAAAWRRELYTAFAPLNADVMHEDLVLTFRALLCGSILALPDVLVCYRRWGGNTSAGADVRGKPLRKQAAAREERSARWSRALAAAYRQMEVDLKTPNDFRKELNAQESVRIANDLKFLIDTHAWRADWWKYSFPHRVLLVARQSCLSQICRETGLWMLPRIFGLRFYTCLFVAATVVKRSIWRGNDSAKKS